ncbi:hypothetical protein BHE74_00019920 [Ensete ventricosum]|nr:hypothetical protein BHE74_00019920 [Ensete ventricosum]
MRPRDWLEAMADREGERWGRKNWRKRRREWINMLCFGHSVAGALRLNPTALPRLAPVTRRGGTLCFSSGQAAPSQYDDGSERKMDRSVGENPSKTQHG